MRTAKFVTFVAVMLCAGVVVVAGSCMGQSAGPVKTIETLASFPAGDGMEALTEAPDGTIYFEVANDDVQSLWKIKPGGQAEKWVDIPIKHPQVVFWYKDGFLVSGSNISVAGGGRGPGAAPPAPVPGGPDPATTAAPPSTTDYDGRLVVLDKNGAVVKIIKPTAGCFLNGITKWHDDYFVVDARNGTIYRIDIAKGELDTWLHDDLMSPTVARTYPGANGIRVFGDWMYWTNTVRSTMYRVHIGKDGRPDGAISPFAMFPGGDDFWFAKDGTIYAPSGTNILKISPTGEVSTFVDMIANSPAAIVSNDQHWVYWTSRGTRSTDPNPVPRLFRVRID